MAAAVTTLPGGHPTVHTYKQAKSTEHTLQQTSTPTAGPQTSNPQTTPDTFSQHTRNTTRTGSIQQGQNIQKSTSTMGSTATSTLDPGPLHTIGWVNATTRHRSLLSTPQETWSQHTRQNTRRTKPFRTRRNNTVCGTSWQRTLWTTSKHTSTFTTSTRHCVGIRPSTRWKGGHPRAPQNERQQRWNRYHHSRLHALVRTNIPTNHSTHNHTTLEHWTTYLGQINPWSDRRATLQKQRVSTGPFKLQMYTAHQCHITSPSQSGWWQNTTPCRTKTVATQWAVWIPQISIHNWTNYAGPKHCRTTTGFPHGLPPAPTVGGYSESIPPGTTRTGMEAFYKVGFSSTPSSATTWTPRFSPIFHSNKSRQRQNLHQQKRFPWRLPKQPSMLQRFSHISTAAIHLGTSNTTRWSTFERRPAMGQTIQQGYPPQIGTRIWPTGALGWGSFRRWYYNFHHSGKPQSRWRTPTSSFSYMGGGFTRR